jgi:peptide/nickel transport system substrate-binding protein
MKRWKILLLCLLSQLPGVFPATTQLEAADKTFLYGLDGSPSTLDSAKAADVRTQRVTWLLCDMLVNTTKDGKELTPGLAESWTASPDGLQVAAKLRPGVVFHDGSPVDAEAVKASLERQFVAGHALYSKESPNVNEARLSALIKEIKVQGPLTLSFSLKYPGLHVLSNVEMFSPSAIAKLGKDFGRKPVCSGPFKFESWTQEQIVLSANEKYWGGRPKLDRVVFRNMTQEQLVDTLIAGQVDFVPVIADPMYFERVQGREGLVVTPVPSLNIFYVGLPTDRPPFDNPKVRKAVVQAINVPRISHYLGRGAAVPAVGPLSSAMKGYDPKIQQARYDPTSSRALLENAGHRTGLKATFLYNDAVTLYSEIAQEFKKALGEVGITLELKGKPSFGEMIQTVRAREGDMFLYSWFVGAPHPERMLPPLFHSRAVGTTNLTRYRNATVDELLDKAAQMADASEQQKLYSRAQQIIVDEAPMVFLYHFTRLAVWAKRVRGLEVRVDCAPYDKLVTVDLVAP